MKDSEQFTPGDDADATLVTPRFDEEETVLAQPVVPLEADAAQSYAPGPSAPPYATRARASRRPWLLVLVLVSAFAGSVIGGAGLYFYQKGRRAQTPDADAATATATAPAEVSQPSNEPPPEVRAETVALPTAPAAPADESAKADDRPSPNDSKDKEDDARKPETEKKSTARRSNDDDEPAVAPKRGKKGDRDDEQVAEGGARRVDSIVYRNRDDERAARRAERRARRREQRQQSRVVDRVRGIFEGQP